MPVAQHPQTMFAVSVEGCKARPGVGLSRTDKEPARAALRARCMPVHIRAGAGAYVGRPRAGDAILTLLVRSDLPDGQADRVLKSLSERVTAERAINGAAVVEKIPASAVLRVARPNNPRRSGRPAHSGAPEKREVEEAGLV